MTVYHLIEQFMEFDENNSGDIGKFTIDHWRSVIVLHYIILYITVSAFYRYDGTKENDGEAWSA